MKRVAQMAAVEGQTIPHPVFPFHNGHASSTAGDFSRAIKQLSVTEKEVEGTKPSFELEEHPIDEVRPIKVGIIGAGLSGITAGVLLPAKLPGLDLRIYDKNEDVGGTW
jgi:hypothetical protein